MEILNQYTIHSAYFPELQLLSLFRLVVIVSSTSNYFTITKIPQRWLTGLINETVTGTIASVTLTCAERPWCYAFCPSGEKDFILLKLFSVAFNDDPQEENKLKCYTKRSRFNIVNAQAEVKVTVGTYVALGSVGNLVNGITTLGLQQGIIVYGPIQYLVFDLGTSKTIQGVSVIGPPEFWNLQRFQEVDIRVGNAPPTGDFSSYQQLGFMSGKAPHVNYEFTAYAPTPLTGRYVSIQKTAETTVDFHVGHVEIFEKV